MARKKRTIVGKVWNEDTKRLILGGMSTTHVGIWGIKWRDHHLWSTELVESLAALSHGGKVLFGLPRGIGKRSFENGWQASCLVFPGGDEGPRFEILPMLSDGRFWDLWQIMSSPPESIEAALGALGRIPAHVEPALRAILDVDSLSLSSVIDSASTVLSLAPVGEPLALNFARVHCEGFPWKGDAGKMVEWQKNTMTIGSHGGIFDHDSVAGLFAMCRSDDDCADNPRLMAAAANTLSSLPSHIVAEPIGTGSKADVFLAMVAALREAAVMSSAMKRTPKQNRRRKSI